jgi:hypothetical protein
MADDSLDQLLGLEARVAQLERERALWVPQPQYKQPTNLYAIGLTTATHDGAWHDYWTGVYTNGFHPAELADGGYTQFRARLDLYIAAQNPGALGSYGVGLNEVFVGWHYLTNFGFTVATAGTVMHFDSGWLDIPAAILAGGATMFAGYITQQSVATWAPSYNFVSVEIR